MEAQRDEGLCYNCDENFGPGHRCETQLVFILETVADAEESAEVEEASNEEEEPATTEISLHALFGIATPQTMRVTGLIKGRRLHILIDSGSTHNFVGRKFAKRMECCKAPAAAIQVMVASGERLQCEEVFGKFKASNFEPTCTRWICKDQIFSWECNGYKALEKFCMIGVISLWSFGVNTRSMFYRGRK